METLLEYTSTYAVEISAASCCRVLNAAGHGRWLRSVFRLLLRRGGDNKRNVCWITGAPNSGKSEFIRRVHPIFASDEVEWRGSRLPVSHTNKPAV